MNMDDKKIPIAVAISYDENDNAPKVSASGKGLVAQRIIDIASENDVPISNNVEVVEALIDIPIGEEIPEILFQVVAIILAPLLISTNKK